MKVSQGRKRPDHSRKSMGNNARAASEILRWAWMCKQEKGSDNYLHTGEVVGSIPTTPTIFPHNFLTTSDYRPLPPEGKWRAVGAHEFLRGFGSGLQVFRVVRGVGFG